MNEDSKRAVLTKLLPEGEQYVLTLLGQQKSPEKTWCYIGMTDKHMVIAHISKENPNKLLREEVVELNQITDVKIKVLDHLIISQNSYISFRKEGWMFD